MSHEAEHTGEMPEEVEPDTQPEGTDEQLDELPALRVELEEARAKEAEYLDGWQRARAELANARRRFEREQRQAYTNAQADLLVRLLPIVDDFERAAETLPENLSELTWIEGVFLIQRKLVQLLEQAGVTASDAVGQQFDPFQHEAVTHEPSASVPEGQIISEMQKGYRLGDRVLRPSMVRVSAGEPLPGEAGLDEPYADKVRSGEPDAVLAKAGPKELLSGSDEESAS